MNAIRFPDLTEHVQQSLTEQEVRRTAQEARASADQHHKFLQESDFDYLRRSTVLNLLQEA